MKASPEKFKEVLSTFPKVRHTLAKLDTAKVPYLVGGSTALYVQGNRRFPHDVDVMFTDDAHRAANDVFGLTLEFIERPNVTVHKSTPVKDGSIDFLSRYTVIADGTPYHYPPKEKVGMVYQDRIIYVVPAEKIVAFKLIGRRQHHHDLDDVRVLMAQPDFDMALFWRVVEKLQARRVVTELLTAL